MLADMLYNLLFYKHTFRVHKRDNCRYFAVCLLTMVDMIMRCNGGKCWILSCGAWVASVSDDNVLFGQMMDMFT